MRELPRCAMEPWRRPAASAAACFIMGIAAHSFLPPWPGVWLALVAGGLLGAMKFRHHLDIGTALIALCLFFCGMAAVQIDSSFFASNEIGRFTLDQPRLTRVEAQIVTPPRNIPSTPMPGRRQLPDRQVMRARAVAIQTSAGWTPAGGRLMLWLDQPRPDLAVGQRLRAFGWLDRPDPPANPGQFNWAQYDRRQRLLASFSVPDPDKMVIVNSPSPSLLDQLRRSARDRLALGFRSEQSLDQALLRALIFGDSDPQLRDVQEQFIRTGTSHHLAISGMHIAVLAGVVYGLCRLLRRTPRWAAVTALGFTLLYGLVAVPSPPVIRSVLLCSAFGLGLLLRRRVDGIQLLALSVLAMLIYRPLDLYNAGFQLSFGTVLGLMLFARPLMDSLRQWGRSDEIFKAPSPPSRRRRVWMWFKGRGIEAASTGAVAWAVSAPLIAFHFQQLNPWAIFAGAAMELIVTAAIIGGFAKILLTVAWPSLAGSWAWLATWPVIGMRHEVALLGHLPASDVPLAHAPDLWMIVLWYAALCLPLLLMRYQAYRSRPLIRRAAIASSAAVCLFIASYIALGRQGPTATAPRLTMLSVGAGQCVVLRLPDGRTILFDAGSSTIPEVYRKCLRPYLRSGGVNRIDAVYLSHSDYDHFSAVADLLDEYPVGAVYMSDSFVRQSRHNMPAESLLAKLHARHCPIHLLQRGDRIQIDSDTTLSVLWPPAQSHLSDNNTSLVLRMNSHGHSILFTGDIQAEAEQQLLEHSRELKSDVLIAPHHGSAESTTVRFVAAVHPQIILSSNDRSLTAKQRRFDRLAPLHRLFRTHECGALTVAGDTIHFPHVTAFLGKPASLTP